MKKLSIIIPCYNEEKSFPLLYNVLLPIINSPIDKKEYKWELVCIDDGSKDATLDVLKSIQKNDSRIVIIELSRNFGKENAMLAGFDQVSGDAMVIIDADLQDPPEIIRDMVVKWEEGYEDVYAKRTYRGKESFLRKKLSLLYYKLLQKSTRFDILQNVGDFRLLDKKCILELRKLRESERYTKGMFVWIGFKKTYIEYKKSDRVAGTSKWKLLDLINLAFNGITSFTIAPLKASMWFGFFISFLAFVSIIYFLCKTIIYGDPVQGFPTLITAILFLGGIQLVSIGILGEYIGRIFNESKHRPVYIIRNIFSKKEEL